MKQEGGISLKRRIQLIAYIIGIVMVIGGFAVGYETMGNEFFELQIETQEKKNIIMSIISGAILIIEGLALNSKEKETSKLLLVFLCGFVVGNFVINTIMYGISQFFNYCGIMNLAFVIVNILIFVTEIMKRKDEK